MLMTFAANSRAESGLASVYAYEDEETASGEMLTLEGSRRLTVRFLSAQWSVSQTVGMATELWSESMIVPIFIWPRRRCSARCCIIVWLFRAYDCQYQSYRSSVEPPF